MKNYIQSSILVLILTTVTFYNVFSQSFCGFTCSDCLKQAFIPNNKVHVQSNVSYAATNISDGYIDYQISKNGCIIDSSCLYGYDAAQNSLVYDVFYPELSCQSPPALPAIILFHGGGFGECTSKEGVEDYCRDFARLGFVAFSVEYRRGKLSDNTTLTASYLLAGYRALQDARGAIRTIIRRQAEGTEPYKIDVDKIFIGGESEGGVIAVNTAYLDQSEADQVMPGVSAVLGSLNDVSPMPPFYYGYPTIHYTIRGVFNLWGALSAADDGGTPADFISPDEPPFIGFHGEMDSTVPYNAMSVLYSSGSKASVSQCDSIEYDNPAAGMLAWLMGSKAIYDACIVDGICAEVYLDSDMKHGFGSDPDPFGLPFEKTSKVKDYIVQRAATFFQAILCNKCEDIQTSLFEDCVNQRCKASSTSDMSDNYVCLDLKTEVESNLSLSFNVITLPSSLKILFNNLSTLASVELYDLTGGKIVSTVANSNELEINTGMLHSGVYLVVVSTSLERITQPVFIAP